MHRQSVGQGLLAVPIEPMGVLHQYLRHLECEFPSEPRGFPFSVPAFAKLDFLEFHPNVTFFVGENGSGKSTLLEAIAVMAGLPPTGGSNNFTRALHERITPFGRHMKLVRGVSQPKTAFFLRAESFYNVATQVDENERHNTKTHPYGDIPLHEQSHGESFLALAKHRFGRNGLYILDEPEAALSPQRQLAFLTIMHRLVNTNSQFVIATHSPILLAFPRSRILHFSSAGIDEVPYEKTEHYALTLDFLRHRDRYLQRLFKP